MIWGKIQYIEYCMWWGIPIMIARFFGHGGGALLAYELYQELFDTAIVPSVLVYGECVRAVVAEILVVGGLGSWCCMR